MTATRRRWQARGADRAVEYPFAARTRVYVSGGGPAANLHFSLCEACRQSSWTGFQTGTANRKAAQKVDPLLTPFSILCQYAGARNKPWSRRTGRSDDSRGLTGGTHAT